MYESYLGIAIIFAIAGIAYFALSRKHVEEEKLKSALSAVMEAEERRGGAPSNVTREDRATSRSLAEERVKDAEAAKSTGETALTAVKGVGLTYAERLQSVGINSVQALREQNAEELAPKLGLSAKRVAAWIKSAQELTT